MHRKLAYGIKVRIRYIITIGFPSLPIESTFSMNEENVHSTKSSSLNYRRLIGNDIVVHAGNERIKANSKSGILRCHYQLCEKVCNHVLRHAINHFNVTKADATTDKVVPDLQMPYVA